MSDYKYPRENEMLLGALKLFGYLNTKQFLKSVFLNHSSPNPQLIIFNYLRRIKCKAYPCEKIFPKIPSSFFDI